MKMLLLVRKMFYFPTIIIILSIIFSSTLSISIPQKRLDDKSALSQSHGGNSHLALVVPYYSGDICRMDLLAKSFHSHNKGTFSRVYLIWLGKRRDIHFPPEYITYFNSPRLFYEDQFPLVGAGWYNQQKVKLLVSKYIAEDTYVVLDSKTMILQDLYREYFLPGGKVRLFQNNKFDDLPQPHKSFFWNTGMFMNLTNDQLHQYHYPESITPFIMKTKVAKQSVEFLKEKNIDLNHIINEKIITEFAYYYLFDLTINNAKDRYRFQLDDSITGYWGGFNEQIINDLLNKDNEELSHRKMIVLHRNWLSAINSKSKKSDFRRRMGELLIRAKMINSPNEMCK